MEHPDGILFLCKVCEGAAGGYDLAELPAPEQKPKIKLEDDGDRKWVDAEALLL